MPTVDYPLVVSAVAADVDGSDNSNEDVTHQYFGTETVQQIHNGKDSNTADSMFLLKFLPLCPSLYYLGCC